MTHVMNGVVATEGVWTHCCFDPILKTYNVIVAGQRIVFCERCGTSRWVMASAPVSPSRSGDEQKEGQ